MQTATCCLITLLFTWPFRPVVPESQTTAQQTLQESPALDQREEILRKWPESQQKAMQQAAYLTFTREVDRVIDSPHGTDHTHYTAEVYGRPSSQYWTQNIVSATINGRSSSGEALEKHEKRWRPNLRLYNDIIEKVNPLPPNTIDQMESITSIRPDTVKGTPVWCFNVTLDDRQDPLERATLWFRQDTLQLEQSRAFYKPVEGYSLIVTTEYIRVGGLDFPRRVQTEGILRYQRRLRSFTLHVTAEATYNNFQLSAGSSQDSSPDREPTNALQPE